MKCEQKCETRCCRCKKIQCRQSSASGCCIVSTVMKCHNGRTHCFSCWWLILKEAHDAM